MRPHRWHRTCAPLSQQLALRIHGYALQVLPEGRIRRRVVAVSDWLHEWSQK